MNIFNVVQWGKVGGLDYFLLLTCFYLSVCRFIILACDGLFKVFSADEAVKFVLGVLQVRVFFFLLLDDSALTVYTPYHCSTCLLLI